MRTYGMYHVGIVKTLVCHFLSDFDPLSEIAKDEILSKKTLKVVSLGGSAGNYIVGFCSALQETSHAIQKLDLKIIDISEGWESIFPYVLTTQRTYCYDDLSEFLQTRKNTLFNQTDLDAEGILEDATMSSTIREADVVLMVKLESLACEQDAEKLIQDVADAMTTGAKLIFIDCSYEINIIRRIPSLRFIYRYVNSGVNDASTDSCEDNIVIFQKRMLTSEEWYSCEEY